MIPIPRCTSARSEYEAAARQIRPKAAPALAGRLLALDVSEIQVSETGQNRTPKKRPRWAKAFLSALCESGNIRLACEAADVARSVVYELRDADTTFAADWECALEESADLLEQEARRRAERGVQRLKFHNGRAITVQALSPEGVPLVNVDGQPIMVPYVEHEYSDTLMIFLLKGVRPEKYRERNETKHTFEPIDWDIVPTDVRDAFIEGRIKLEDVYRLVRTPGA